MSDCIRCKDCAYYRSGSSIGICKFPGTPYGIRPTPAFGCVLGVKSDGENHISEHRGTFKEEFALRLRTIRERRGFSSRTLAERSGVDLSAIYKYERGEYLPKIDTVLWLSQALGVTMEYLWTGEDSACNGAPNGL